MLKIIISPPPFPTLPAVPTWPTAQSQRHRRRLRRAPPLRTPRGASAAARRRIRRRGRRGGAEAEGAGEAAPWRKPWKSWVKGWVHMDAYGFFDGFLLLDDDGWRSLQSHFFVGGKSWRVNLLGVSIYVFLGFLLEGSWSGPTPSSRSNVLSMQVIDGSPVQPGIVTRKAPWKCD